MTTKHAGLLVLVALLSIAGIASAEEKANESNTTRPDDAAWVEDCPPDHMCAFGAEENESEPIAYGNESCIECSGPARGPEDCENCRGDTPVHSHMPVDGNATGWDPSVDCPEGSQCLANGADDGREPDTESADGEAQNDASFVSLLVVGGAVGLAAVTYAVGRRE